MGTYEMAALLRADPNRIKITSLSNGSDSALGLVNTVLTPVGGGASSALKRTTERSPRALVSLLRKLQDDTSSTLHQAGSFFVDIDRAHYPDPIKVRLCPDKIYRVFCPYRQEIVGSGQALGFFVIGALAMPLTLVLFCFLV